MNIWSCENLNVTFVTHAVLLECVNTQLTTIINHFYLVRMLPSQINPYV
jgi:hypothetical protein